jgi:hypothetical protein
MILSDDFGVGFPVLFLMEKFGLDDFVETSAFLKANPGVAKLRSKLKKVGPKKKPDYMALDARGGIHVLECKGTQTSPRALEAAMKAGAGQKNNISPAGARAFASRMVGGIYVPQHAHKKLAVIQFRDPDWEGLAAIINAIHPHERVTTMQRLSLAKQLSLLDLGDTARVIALPNAPPLTSAEYDMEHSRVLGGQDDLFRREITRTWPEVSGSPKNRERLPRACRLTMSYPRTTLDLLVEMSRRPAPERSTIFEGLPHEDWLERTPTAEQVDDESTTQATLTSRSGFKLQLEVDWPAS